MYNEKYLAHHGILGMKWGVKKAISAYSKASNSKEKAKAKAKLSNELEKDSKKLSKLNMKATKSLNKAVKARYGFFGSEKKYQMKKQKADRKAYKAKKWYDQMSNTFSKQSVVSISDSDRKLGEKYINYFKQSSGISRGY